MADIEYIGVPGYNPALEAFAAGITSGVNQFYDDKEKEQELLGRSLPYLISAGLVQPTKDPESDISLGGIGFNYSTPTPDLSDTLSNIKTLGEIQGTDSANIAAIRKRLSESFDVDMGRIKDDYLQQVASTTGEDLSSLTLEQIKQRYVDEKTAETLHTNRAITAQLYPSLPSRGTSVGSVYNQQSQQQADPLALSSLARQQQQQAPSQTSSGSVVGGQLAGGGLKFPTPGFAGAGGSSRAGQIDYNKAYQLGGSQNA